MSEIDFSEDAKELRTPTPEELNEVTRLAQQQLAVEQQIKEQEEATKKLKEEYRRISERELPELMLNCGLREFKTLDNHQVAVKEEVYASIPAKKKKLAFDWLRENGLGDLIKNNIEIPLNRGNDAVAANIIDFLNDNQIQGWSNKEGIHPATLKSMIKERIAEGLPIPLDTFGAYEYKKAVVK